MHKIFGKLGVKSRRELRGALLDADGVPVPA
jgi:hypothetical protein